MDHDIQPGSVQEDATYLHAVRGQGQLEFFHRQRLPPQPGLFANQIPGTEITDREIAGQHQGSGIVRAISQPQRAADDPLGDRTAYHLLQIGVGRYQGDVGDIQPNVRGRRRDSGGAFDLHGTTVVDQQPSPQGKPGIRRQRDVGGLQCLDPQQLCRRFLQRAILETQTDIAQRQAGQGHRPVPARSGIGCREVFARRHLLQARRGRLRRPHFHCLRTCRTGLVVGGLGAIRPGRLGLGISLLSRAFDAGPRSPDFRGGGRRRLRRRCDPGVLQQIERPVGIQPGRQLAVGQGQRVDLQALLRPIQGRAVQIDARQFKDRLPGGVRQRQIPHLHSAVAQAQPQTLRAVQPDVPRQGQAAPGELDSGIRTGHIGRDPSQRQVRFYPGVGGKGCQGCGSRQSQTAGVADAQIDPVVTAGVGQGGEPGNM